ncbi:MAG: hypothetical protein M1821_006056 [Bathelium mastoideum]|nr:MAG: hypothetical protein M1821_006056 [Bathelium mastoideum]
MVQNTTASRPVLIIGAGVSGLALAQGLCLCSIPFRLFERHSRFNTLQGHRFRISGDGIAAVKSILSPEAQELFKRTAAERARFQPRYVDIKKMKFAEPTIVETPESMPVDRTWLRLLMTRGIEDAIEYDKDLLSFEVDTDGVNAIFSDGSQAKGAVLIGADGIRSRVRQQLQPHRKLLDLERWILWGRTPLTDELRQRLTKDVVTWFMAIDEETNVQVVIEPMLWTKSTEQESERKLPEFRDYIYWAVATEAAPTDPKSAEGRKMFLEEISKSWDSNLKLIFDKTSYEFSASVPVLSSKPDLEMDTSVSAGMVTTVGDAAHPMSPMGGSGGDTALQSVTDLLSAIDQFGFTEDGMRHFEAVMGPRARSKIERSFRNGQKFWKGKEWYEYHATAVD